jgi:hypothetical protein
MNINVETARLHARGKQILQLGFCLLMFARTFSLPPYIYIYVFNI